MDWKGLRRQLVSQHPHSPQNVTHIEHALLGLEEALRTLSRLGHQFHIAPGEGSPFPEWPRLMFHFTIAPNGRLVQSPWEADDLGPGWYDTLAEAQYAEGKAKQDSGRGGIHRRALPVPLENRGTVEQRLEAKALEWKRKRERNGTSE